MDEAQCHQLLSACFSAFDVRSIGRMCTANKAVRRLLLDLVRLAGGRFLPEIAQQAAQVYNERQQQSPVFRGLHWLLPRSARANAPLQWLLRQAPAAAATADVPALLHIPDMAAEVAGTLIAAGVHITYSQLAAAARSRIRGVLVWVQALQRYPGKLAASGIPQVVRDLAADDYWGEPEARLRAYQPSPADPGLPDVLHCAVNAVVPAKWIYTGIEWTSTCERRALRLLSDQLLAEQPQLVLELLTTAVERHSLPITRRLLEAPAARSVGPAALAQLLQPAMRLPALLNVLLALPAAAQLDADQHIVLLESALRQGANCEVRRQEPGARLAALLKLPGAAGIDTAAFVELAQAAMAAGGSQPSTSQSLKALLAMPAAAAVTVAQLQQLLVAAIDQGQCSCMALLLGLPVAATLSREACAQLLQHAVATGYSDYVDELRRLPQPVDEATLAQLLQAAAQQNNFQMMRSMLKVPGASAATAGVISVEAVMQLLTSAVDSDKPGDVQLACQLPAAASIQGPQVLQLLKAASSSNEPVKLVQALSKLPGISSISATDVQQLLPCLPAAAAGGTRRLGIINVLRTRLPAAAAAALPTAKRERRGAAAAAPAAPEPRAKRSKKK